MCASTLLVSCQSATPRAVSNPGPTADTSPTPVASRTYAASDLAAIMPTPSQTDGWQTATRQDLTGPYGPTTNPNPLEAPLVDTNGFVAGQRATIGDPGAPGLNVVRVSAEVGPDCWRRHAALHRRAHLTWLHGRGLSRRSPSSFGGEVRDERFHRAPVRDGHRTKGIRLCVANQQPGRYRACRRRRFNHQRPSSSLGDAVQFERSEAVSAGAARKIPGCE